MLSCSHMYHFMRRNPHSGFTLIEMLVVIAIISVLAAIVLFSVEEARKSSRDKQRKIDLKNMQLAVELYKEAHDVYPLSCKGDQPNRLNSWGGALTGNQSCSNPSDYMIVGVVPNFISKLPKDPRESGSAGYVYASDGKTYKIMALQTLEKIQITTIGEEWARCSESCRINSRFSTNCNLSANYYKKTLAVYGGNNDSGDSDSIMCR